MNGPQRDETGKGMDFLCGAVLQLPKCGCTVEGEGTCQAPVRIIFCQTHSPPTTLQEKARAARDLANELCKDTCPRACLEAEHLRPLKGRDAISNRPFYQYDPARLCGNCRAYWYVELAAQTLSAANTLNKEKTR